MKQYHFQLTLSYQEFQHYYAGNVQQIIVRTYEGARVQIPAMRFQPFLLPGGISGSFCLTLDEHHKFVRLEKVAS